MIDLHRHPRLQPLVFALRLCVDRHRRDRNPAGRLLEIFIKQALRRGLIVVVHVDGVAIAHDGQRRHQPVKLRPRTGQWISQRPIHVIRDEDHWRAVVELPQSIKRQLRPERLALGAVGEKLNQLAIGRLVGAANLRR